MYSTQRINNMKRLESHPEDFGAEFIAAGFSIHLKIQ